MEKDISGSRSTINLHETIESIRNQLLQKGISQISNAKSINPFNEVKPLSINDFQQELSKYNVSLDNSYIEGVISQINAQLFIRLLNKTQENILQNLISSSNDLIKPLTHNDLIQNYKVDLDDKDINVLLTNVNREIEMKNKARTKNKKYKRLTECFIELAETDVQKDAIKQIMETGEYNGFKLNSMLSIKNYDEKVERERRISFVEMLLHDENLFFYLVNNGINVFHGTEVSALQTILNNGLMSSKELNDNEIQLNTGEEKLQTDIFGYKYNKRNFVSLTDHFDTAATIYAQFPFEESDKKFKEISDKDRRNDRIPIIICFNGNDIKQKYSESIVSGISGDLVEIPITSSISSRDIKCVITSYDKIDYVKSIASQYGIDVLGYDNNDKFKKRFYDREGKFYSSNLEVDEKEFERTKERIKLKKDSQNNLDSKSTPNIEQKAEHLSEDLSMMYASDLKMNIVFNLTQQYNSGVPFIPITADNLISKYNINESVAQKLASEINTMLENYIREKEYQQQNYTPYVLDGFEEESIGKHR